MASIRSGGVTTKRPSHGAQGKVTSESWPSRRVGAVYTDDWRVEFSMRVHFGTVSRNMLVPQRAVGPGSGEGCVLGSCCWPQK